MKNCRIVNADIGSENGNIIMGVALESAGKDYQYKAPYTDSNMRSLLMFTGCKSFSELVSCGHKNNVGGIPVRAKMDDGKVLHLVHLEYDQNTLEFTQAPTDEKVA